MKQPEGLRIVTVEGVFKHRSAIHARQSVLREFHPVRSLHVVAPAVARPGARNEFARGCPSAGDVETRGEVAVVAPGSCPDRTGESGHGEVVGYLLGNVPVGGVGRDGKVVGIVHLDDGIQRIAVPLAIDVLGLVLVAQNRREGVVAAGNFPVEPVLRGHESAVGLADGIEAAMPVVECREVEELAFGHHNVGHGLPIQGTAFAELGGAGLIRPAALLDKPEERASDGVGTLVGDVHACPQLVGIVAPDDGVAHHLVDIDLDVVALAVAAACHQRHARIGIGGKVVGRVGRELRILAQCAVGTIQFQVGTVGR